MAYTVQEIHNMAIAIIDEISDNGTIDPTKTREYANRCPYLTDMGQKELADKGCLYYIEEYENTDESNLDRWNKYTLPTDFKKIKDLIFEDADMQLPPIRYRQFGNTDIYFYFTSTGTVRLLYIPIPAKITALNQPLAVDESISIALAYYDAEHYALADQNDEVAAKCRMKFEQLKADLTVKTPRRINQIVDVYSVNRGV
jgi:hypothetical protein